MHTCICMYMYTRTNVHIHVHILLYSQSLLLAQLKVSYHAHSIMHSTIYNGEELICRLFMCDYIHCMCKAHYIISKVVVHVFA